METTVLKVEGMSCEHCVKAVTAAVNALPGVAKTSVDLAGKSVTVEHDGQSAAGVIAAAIEDQGYEVI
jgi:copper chaperone